MRVLFILLVLLTFNVSAQNETDHQVSTYYLIRHAEKDQSDKANRNPYLTEKGLQRAENWAKVFSNINFDMVFSTQYNRTTQTATPTAKANNLEIEYYNPRDFKLERFIEKTRGKTVLIVGHSNTTPFLTNKLLGNKKYKQIDESNNSNLYIVTFSEDSKSTTLLRID